MEWLHKNSYDILYNRITDRGYAVTSLTGLYIGMFPRDSSIQAMAHISHGDSVSARKILRYLLSYHVALDLKRTAHIIEEIKDEEYGNTYLQCNEKEKCSGYISQRRDSMEIYLINAPNNRAAQQFSCNSDTIYGVEVSLTNTYSTDTVNVMICSDYRDESSAIAKAVYTFKDSVGGWQYIEFDAPAKVVPNKIYYLMIVAHQNSGRVVWNGATRLAENMPSYNYDLGCFGGWETKSHGLAFEIVTYRAKKVSKRRLACNTQL